MSNNFYHERNFQQSRTHVLVRGVGTEYDAGLSADVLVHAEYTTHAADYPNRYLPDGWGGEPYFDADIDTLAKAADVATAIGDTVWGALGTLGWQTDGVAVGGTAVTRFHQGDLIMVDDPVEGQSDVVYPIRHVERVSGTTGHPIWAITVGDEPPDVLDLIRGITVIRPLQAALTAAGGMGAGSGAGLGTQGMPGTPRQVPVSRTPTNSKAGVLMPQYNDTTGLTIRGNVQDRDPGAPADPAYYAYPFQVTPPATPENPAPDPRLYTTHDGYAHPFSYAFGYIATAGTYGTHVPYPLAFQRFDLKGTGTVDFFKNTTHIGLGPYTLSDERVLLDVYYPFDPSDDLWVVLSDLTAPGLSVYISEVR